ncbi:MAG: aminopeptidase [Clostridiales bacterium]|nr:aminopeptidase [Clostridiales bacterium]
MSEQKKLREELLLNGKNGYDRVSTEELSDINGYCENYKDFLNHGRTERECVETAIALAEAEGFRAYEPGQSLQPGERIYWNNRGKALMLAVIGQETLDQGVVIGAAHIDSPRLDLKPRPVTEDSGLCTLKTHYYGGIRKYQWVSIPLLLTGVVERADGTQVKVSIGRDPGDPVLTIPDLLPHLADKQSHKPLFQGIEGEQLNLLIGSKPLPDDDGSDRVKLAVLKLLHEKYGITEADFISAELCAVPAFNAVDVGLDRSMIGAYGQDDRVCGYAALSALMELGTPRRTCIATLADKEEIGSIGVSGMESQAFDTFVARLCAAQGVELRDCYEKSFCLSTDVTVAYDPNFAEVFDKSNASFLNQGVGLCKYTGSRGKSGSSDASAELVGQVRRTLDKAGVIWQMAELGKVDEGGGGTVAMFMANRNIDTIDAGTPVLAMHSPFEVTSKLDCYMTYKAMKAVFEA